MNLLGEILSQKFVFRRDLISGGLSDMIKIFAFVEVATRESWDLGKPKVVFSCPFLFGTGLRSSMVLARLDRNPVVLVSRVKDKKMWNRPKIDFSGGVAGSEFDTFAISSCNFLVVLKIVF